jgi:glycosyltransferase involved in cell wall biosynthesis
MSEASKRDILHYFNVTDEQVRVTYNGRSSLYQPAAADDVARVRDKYALPENYLLYVGSIEQRKNLDGTLNAYHVLREKGIDHKLVIVGPAKWLYSDIMTTVDTLGIKDDIIFTGWVDQEDLPVLYTGADVFVFPSLYEGFGIPPLEAMSCGTPVVTSNVSSLPEVVGDAALTVDPRNTQSIADAIHLVIQDRDLHHRLSQQGLKRAERFTWEQTACDTLDIYRGVLSR